MVSLFMPLILPQNQCHKKINVLLSASQDLENLSATTKFSQLASGIQRNNNSKVIKLETAST